jgi:hypothetical protein
MRWSLCFAAAILIVIPVFSTPIPRMMLRKRGLFQETLQASDVTIQQLAAWVANTLTDDPRPCECSNPTQSFISAMPEFAILHYVSHAVDTLARRHRLTNNLQVRTFSHSSYNFRRESQLGVLQRLVIVRWPERGRCSIFNPLVLLALCRWSRS